MISTAPNSVSLIPLVISTYTQMPIPSWMWVPLSRRARLLGAQLGISGLLERQVERTLVVADVVVRA